MYISALFPNQTRISERRHTAHLRARFLAVGRQFNNRRRHRQRKQTTIRVQNIISPTIGDYKTLSVSSNTYVQLSFVLCCQATSSPARQNESPPEEQSRHFGKFNHGYRHHRYFRSYPHLQGRPFSTQINVSNSHFPLMNNGCSAFMANFPPSLTISPNISKSANTSTPATMPCQRLAKPLQSILAASARSTLFPKIFLI